MITYTTINNSQIDLDSPVTEPLMTALRDNPLAIQEGTAGAPVIRSAWHPYNSTVSQTGDGVIYDFSTDGAVANLVTPDFEDGYIYGFSIEGVGASTGAPDFRVELFLAPLGSYFVAFEDGLSAVTARWGWIELLSPRQSLLAHTVSGSLVIGGTGHLTGQVTKIEGVGAAAAQTVTRARFSFGLPNLNSGVIRMFRRWDYLTA